MFLHHVAYFALAGLNQDLIRVAVQCNVPSN